jgi:mono/diheme cytochrome c family protein
MRWVLLAAALLPLLAACYTTGAYPVDYFPEMHYGAAYRRQEPPRLAPPTASVPITGRERMYTLPESVALQNPVPASPDNLARAQRLYQVNCSACHGPNGRGDGVVAAWFVHEGQTPPADYTNPGVASLSDGQLYWVVTNGLGGMPPFGSLLTPEERWLLVDFIRQVQGR